MANYPVDGHTPLSKIEFPESWGKDVQMQARIACERWTKYFELIKYYSLKKEITPHVNYEDTVGEAGTTKFDPLWREPVPIGMDVWEQAQHSDTFDATDTMQFNDAVETFFSIVHNPPELELKKVGFDKVRDLVAKIPILFLDQFGIGAKPGDYFMWDGDEYTIVQCDRVGYWKNSNVRIFWMINAVHRRKGS